MSLDILPGAEEGAMYGCPNILSGVKEGIMCRWFIIPSGVEERTTYRCPNTLSGVEEGITYM